MEENLKLLVTDYLKENNFIEIVNLETKEILEVTNLEYIGAKDDYCLVKGSLLANDRFYLKEYNKKWKFKNSELFVD